MNVIRLTPNDQAEILAIGDVLLSSNATKASAGHLINMLKDDRTYLFVAKLDGKIIGYTWSYRFPSLYSDHNMAYLYDIEVLPAYRRKGVGRLLLNALLDQLAADNVIEVFLGTGTDNTEAQAFYGSTGGIKSAETFIEFTYEMNNQGE